MLFNRVDWLTQPPFESYVEKLPHTAITVLPATFGKGKGTDIFAFNNSFVAQDPEN